MPTPTNQLNGLWLHLGTENSEPYEVECEGCKGKGHWFEGHLDEFETARRAKRECPYCHGKGQHTVRLVGVVEVVLERGWLRCAHTYNPKFITPASEPDYEGLISECNAAYRAGTLPDTVRAHLREVDAE